jgi:hypothetical protein
VAHPDFELFNPLQPGQRKSRLQHLIDIFAFREEWAMEAVERLESLDALNEETARQAIDLAWRAFQKANSGALMR